MNENNLDSAKRQRRAELGVLATAIAMPVGLAIGLSYSPYSAEVTRKILQQILDYGIPTLTAAVGGIELYREKGKIGEYISKLF